MDEVLVSVIVPVYNSEAYLDECIRSLLDQTMEQFEILLVNDGSTDSSGVICDHYSTIDSRVKTFHKVNGGVSSARNVGLEKANGIWICFVDSDDYVDPMYLENLLYYKNNDLVIGGMTYCGECTGKDERVNDLIFCTSDFADYITDLERTKMVFYYSCGKLFKRSIIRKSNIKFRVGMAACEDTCFNMEYVLYIEKICVTKYTDYNYRIIRGSKRSMNFHTYNRHLMWFDECFSKLRMSYACAFSELYADIHRSMLNLFLGYTKTISLEKFIEEATLFSKNHLNELHFQFKDRSIARRFYTTVYRYPYYGYVMLCLLSCFKKLR